MHKKQQKIIAFPLMFIFTIIAFFGCIFAIQNSESMHNNMHVSMNACCESDDVFGTISHDIQIILSSVSRYSLFILLLFFIFDRFFNFKHLNYRSKIKNYFKTRDRYGGFRLFNYLNILFSQGIIHPKVF